MAENELINKGLTELRALGAEIEKVVKTASDEAKEGWQKLQPHLQQAEKMAATKANEIAQEVGESTGEFISDVRGRLEALRARIRDEKKG
ncbi:hypothetical protein G6O69_11175 [Pseudenhygromyxa sp. WMMC2535]|uniref:hypothetical protein n=1 Tax=Pseudenhygromyxa sp. WMMC2535 TaxID=2712867 RepID=UPI0015564830|nr:hypothetical protein [Pseudenhygromyxa sp. WMMC2535]NVB38393.1 hypothetical protein [Pseudenhygromyxa sp. WMMC2535]